METTELRSGVHLPGLEIERDVNNHIAEHHSKAKYQKKFQARVSISLSITGLKSPF